MKTLSIILLSCFCLISNAMERIEKDKSVKKHHHHSHHSQEAAIAVMANDQKFSSGLYAVDFNDDAADIEDGQLKEVHLTEPVEKKRTERFVLGDDGKRHSLSFSAKQVEAAMAEQAKELEAIDLSDEALRKQMAKDILQIVLGDGAHKKYKHARAHIADAIQQQHKSPKSPHILNELACARKVSENQITARRKDKAAKNSPYGVVRLHKASPRQLFLQNSPNKNAEDTAYSAIKDLVIEQLAEAGVSQQNQKYVSQAIAVVGPIVVGGITFLITNYTKSCSN